MEKLNLKRAIAFSTAVVAGALMLEGCSTGKADAPNVENIRNDSEFIEIARPDGQAMDCIFYSQKGTAGYSGYSWMALDCDWGHPHSIEQGQEPTTTTTSISLPTIDRIG